VEASEEGCKKSLVWVGKEGLEPVGGRGDKAPGKEGLEGGGGAEV